MGVFSDECYLSGVGWPTFSRNRYILWEVLGNVSAILHLSSFHWHFAHHNSNSLAILFCSNPNSNAVITTKFCTWHDSGAVVSCVKIRSDLIARKQIIAKGTLHRILDMSEKSLVKWVSGTESVCSLACLPHKLFLTRVWVVFEWQNNICGDMFWSCL